MPTTLLTRLLIGHVTPVVVVSVALIITMTSLLRITHVLRDISEMELSSLHRESALHRASWSLDVTMRRHERACRVANVTERAHTDILEQRRELERVLGATPEASDGMLSVARGWLNAASEALAGDVCVELNRLDLQTDRAQLDDRMTELWTQRLNELHTGLEGKETSAQRMGGRAVLAGAVLSGGLTASADQPRRLRQASVPGVSISRAAHAALEDPRKPTPAEAYT